MADSAVGIFTAAAQFDPALRPTPDLLRRLARKRVRSRAASREALFAAIAAGRPVILTHIDVPVAGADKWGVQGALLRALTHNFRRETASAQMGPNYARRRIPITDLLRRWNRGQHLVSITDLHLRGTALERTILTDSLSAFNLLPLGSDNMRRQEMMTMVISSRGNVTDSHSDDPDGSNHCFVGRKLWLAWETFEGQVAGLQDCSRDVVHDRANFDLQTFASLKTAKWWTVGAGDTLFLPGRLSHRVVTLESYMGIGSFYCTPASCLDNLSRWYHHGPLWSLADPQGDNDGLVDEIAVAMARNVRRLRKRAPRTQEQWGLDFAKAGMRRWERLWSGRQRRELMKITSFAHLVHALRSASAKPEQSAFIA